MTSKLSRRRILRGRGSFSEILSKGTPVVAGSVKLFFVPVPPPSQPRIGFATLRGIKNAAVRNRIKRCLREAFRTQQHLVPPDSGDMILMYVGRTPRRSSEIDCTKIGKDVLEALTTVSRKVQ